MVYELSLKNALIVVMFNIFCWKCAVYHLPSGQSAIIPGLQQD